jgi:CPA2 family monovalent cation:H+ antiporter-2
VAGTQDINITAYSDALVVLGTAGILIPITRRWGLNPVLGYLAAGAILGPLGLGSFINEFHVFYWFTITDATNVSGIAELGIVFLLFVIGLELSLQRLASLRRLVGGLGGLQVVLSTCAIAGCAVLMGLSAPDAVVIGASLSLSSTAIVLEILTRQHRLSTTSGQAIFAVLLAQDLAAIPLLVFVSIGASQRGGSVLVSLIEAIAKGLFAIAAIVVFGRYLMRPLFRIVASVHSTEFFIAAVLFVIIASGVVAHQAGLSMGMGAFVAGLLLAGTEFRKAIQASIEPFKSLLLGIFFFTVGMRVDIRELGREPALLFGLVLALIAVKSVILALLGKSFRLSWPDSMETGLLLGPGGEFAFVIIGLAADLHMIDNRTSGITLAVTSLSMAATPGLAALAARLRKRAEQMEMFIPELAIRPEAQSNHAIVIGYGRVGKVVCSLLDRTGVRYVATDFDPHAVMEDLRNGHQVYCGDATDAEFLKACGLEEAAAVVITINSREAIDTIVPLVRSIRPEIPIISRARDADHARRLYSIGATQAVPETIEASLQLSEAALVQIKVNPDAANAAVQGIRAQIHRELNQPEQNGEETHR